MAFENILQEYNEKKIKALAMGSAAKLEQRKNDGILNARERISYLVDQDSFIESGLFGTSSAVESDREKTPADGKITGYAKIDGRDVAVVSNDFTVKGASSSATNGKKIGQMKRVATQRGLPIVFLGESSGARMPDTMGSKGMGSMLGNDPTQYRRMRETPWASAVLGYCYGSSTWYTGYSDFSVMRKGAIMAVSSPQLVSLAIKEQVDPEEIGGWKLHSETTGLIDRVVETDEEALDSIKEFLSYMPAHHKQAPPVCPVPKDSGSQMTNILDLLPEKRTQVYDVRKVIQAIVDTGSYFELKPRFGKVLVTALTRLNGHSVGIIANNPLVKGGAMDTEACEKATNFIVMCDSFNIPIVMLVDTPGFIIGLDAERKRAPGKIINFMSAVSLTTVPKITVVLRKSYGQAYLNMGGGRNSDEFAAWPTAEISFMDPNFATSIVHGLNPGDDGYEEAVAEMAKGSNVWDIASMYAVQSVVLPSETRDYLIRMLEVHRMRLSNGVGEHLMRTWPTAY
ncbi:acyl-CoA carboxylase subunit beta [Polynucleobacter nymphae]|uniref:acyl-CoA carboxylase subunit beta n=1 Tax=Polynucleobacter nymphae TaxID=2081043 RepID=UPI001C0E4AA8|nr:carboxyl transferase domain-containing protein [Polynucleobacter nymphae]MBU3608707.1 methylmalonyl-CoA carboxyltransferase [Polynucleobacter nymphae]